MYVVVWEYEVRAGSERSFEVLYGAGGAWVELFREYPGYLGTELLRGANGRYLSIDRWSTAAAYESFLADAESRYATIDAQGDALTDAERLIGRYESC